MKNGVVMLLCLGGASLALAQEEWEQLYRKRLQWWSLQPLAAVTVPEVKDADWCHNDVDRFILAKLEAQGLRPSSPADERALERRLSFALTGLPPLMPGQDVKSLLNSRQFGERFARHWMDVVHYADTHGYERDVEAKGAWRYRDYLVRAFSEDVPFDQFILEHLAGDLLPQPRIEAATGMNESLLATLALRMGERRNGDNSQFEGITEEAVENVIDTMSKGFLATTVACARCHDHKLDAVAQQDYYALAGVLMSSRFIMRSVDTVDPNTGTLAEMRELKTKLHAELSRSWTQPVAELAAKVAVLPEPEPVVPAQGRRQTVPAPVAPAFPATPLALWHELKKAGEGEVAARWQKWATEFQAQRQTAQDANAKNLKLIADFTEETLPAGWQVEGLGMKSGLVRDGEVVIADEGDAVVKHLLPAGRWSHVWSSRLAGAVRSPLLETSGLKALSLGHAGGDLATFTSVTDHATQSVQMDFLTAPQLSWRQSGTQGGGKPPRRYYLEFATKALNNNYPPNVGYRGFEETFTKEQREGPRSWFGITRVYAHEKRGAGEGPLDELGRFVPLFEDKDVPQNAAEAARRIAICLDEAVKRWARDAASSEDVVLINAMLNAGLLPNRQQESASMQQLVTAYRAAEARIIPDRTLESVADLAEARDVPIGIRGSYTEFGAVVPRGGIRFLPAAAPAPGRSGRLELAQSIASERNPLTARVYVNRVWHWLFGEGLVRTPDDFGHLGELPTHPELLDWLAARFMADGWSTQKLVRLIVTSAAWQQSSTPDPAAMKIDPENRLLHHLPLRRLEAECVHDAVLSVAGRLVETPGGPALEPHRLVEVPAQRLSSGPLDSAGRRSLYLKASLAQPARLAVIFNQPIPKLTTGKRDVTNVPEQALTLLNDPFIIAMAAQWSQRVLSDGSATPETRVRAMFERALSRPPTAAETARLLTLAQRTAVLHGSRPAALLDDKQVWQDVAHAIFNLKEFLYVR